MGKLTTKNSKSPSSCGLQRKEKCRFCGRAHALSYSRRNHEQHCEDNPERGYAIDGIVFNEEGLKND